MAEEMSTEPLEKPAKTAPPGKMTYEEFLAWANEDTWAEWVNGEEEDAPDASTSDRDLSTTTSPI